MLSRRGPALNALTEQGVRCVRGLEFRRPAQGRREWAAELTGSGRFAGDFVGSRLSETTSVIFSGGLRPTGLAAGKVLCVGDDLENDVRGAIRAGLSACCSNGVLASAGRSSACAEPDGIGPEESSNREVSTRRLTIDQDEKHHRRRVASSDESGRVSRGMRRLALPPRTTWISIRWSGRPSDFRRVTLTSNRSLADTNGRIGLRSTRDALVLVFSFQGRKENARGRNGGTTRGTGSRSLGRRRQRVDPLGASGRRGRAGRHHVHRERAVRQAAPGSPASAAIVGPHFKLGPTRGDASLAVIEVDDPIAAFLAVRTHLSGEASRAGRASIPRPGSPRRPGSAGTWRSIPFVYVGRRGRHRRRHDAPSRRGRSATAASSAATASSIPTPCSIRT